MRRLRTIKAGAATVPQVFSPHLCVGFLLLGLSRSFFSSSSWPSSSPPPLLLLSSFTAILMVTHATHATHIVNITRSSSCHSLTPHITHIIVIHCHSLTPHIIVIPLLLCHPHGNPRHTPPPHSQHHALILLSLTHTTHYAHITVIHCHSLSLAHPLEPCKRHYKRTLQTAPSETARSLGANPLEDSKRH